MSEDKNVKKKGFWKGMKSELKKVIWPTGEQTVKSTFATIAFVIMVSLVLIVFNLFFNWLSNLWIRGLSHEDVINNIVISGDADNQEDSAISGEINSDAEESDETISIENPTEESVDTAEESVSNEEVSEQVNDASEE